MIYCTTYCNHGHCMQTGKPVAHECYVLPAAALAAEYASDYETAIDIISRAQPLRVHRGLPSPERRTRARVRRGAG